MLLTQERSRLGLSAVQSLQILGENGQLPPSSADLQPDLARRISRSSCHSNIVHIVEQQACGSDISLIDEAEHSGGEVVVDEC